MAPFSIVRASTIALRCRTVVEIITATWERLREWTIGTVEYHISGNGAAKTRRIIKVSVALTAAVSLTLPRTLSSRYGENPFLLGTIAIYLFPIKTTGAQFVGSVIGLSGILFGLAYANLVLWISNHMKHDETGRISIWRHVFLWVSLVIGAFMSGYLRSKITRSYLAINFFMVVNMFALIRGVDHFDKYFHDFFYVMIIGVAVSLVIGLILWPEDHSGTLRRNTLDCLQEAKSLLTTYATILNYGGREELDLSPLIASENRLGASLHEAHYEWCLSRVDPECVRPIHRCLKRLIIIARVFNATIRRKRKLPRMLLAPTSLADTRCSTDLNGERTATAIQTAFEVVLFELERMESRVKFLYSGHQADDINSERLYEARGLLSSCITSDIRRRQLEECRDLEDASFTDQTNCSILELLDVILDMSRTIVAIDPGRFRLVPPRILRRSSLLQKLPIVHALSGLGSRSDAYTHRRSFMTTAEEYLLFETSNVWYKRALVWISEEFILIQRSRHLKYAVKFAVAMGILSLPAFISDWYLWYEDLRCQLAMISAMVAMETTQGLTFRTAGMKLVGALLGGLLAFIVAEVAKGSVKISIGLTAPVGLIIGYLLLHNTWSKAGTVCALAYNLILGVATVFPDNHISVTISRRLLTLPVGLAVATLVHLVVYPYHSRSQLVLTLSSALDWMHHLVFAIEASVQFPHLERKFDSIVYKTSHRLQLARTLLPATRYEVSLGGRWPLQRFEKILDTICDVLDLIVGDTPCEPELSIHLDNSRTCLQLRAKLLASLCNDLLVTSHTLRARLQMPRHESSSVEILNELLTSVYVQVTTQQNTPELYSAELQRRFDDIGRLADLVSEISFLRSQVDQLNQEIQIPKDAIRPPTAFSTRPNTPSNLYPFSHFSSPRPPFHPSPPGGEQDTDERVPDGGVENAARVHVVDGRPARHPSV